MKVFRKWMALKANINNYLYWTIEENSKKKYILWYVGWRGDSVEKAISLVLYLKNYKVSSLYSHHIISSADLGGSSNYSKETLLNKAVLILKTEVAKVFMTTEIAHELVDPNPKDYEK